MAIPIYLAYRLLHSPGKNRFKPAINKRYTLCSLTPFGHILIIACDINYLLINVNVFLNNIVGMASCQKALIYSGRYLFIYK